jgi:hypothetical protein
MPVFSGFLRIEPTPEVKARFDPRPEMQVI